MWVVGYGFKLVFFEDMFLGFRDEMCLGNFGLYKVKKCFLNVVFLLC